MVSSMVHGTVRGGGRGVCTSTATTWTLCNGLYSRLADARVTDKHDLGVECQHWVILWTEGRCFLRGGVGGVAWPARAEPRLAHCACSPNA